MSNTPIDPDDNVEDILNGMSSLDEATAWVTENAGSLTDEQREEALTWVQEFTTDASSPVAREWENLLTAPETPGFNVVQVLNGLDQEQIDEYFAENYWGLTAAQQGAARQWLANTGGSHPAAAEVVYGSSTGTPSPGAIDAQAMEDAEREAIDYISDIYYGAQPGSAPTLDAINNYVPAGLTAAERDAWIARVTTAGRQDAEDRLTSDQVKAGTEETTARAVAQRQLNSLGLDTVTPGWLMELNGGDLTDDEKARYVAYWNDDHGTNFTSFDDIAPMLETMGHTAYTEGLTSSVLAAQEPLISHSIEIPFVNGRRSVTYTQDEMQTLRDMGFSNDAITRMVRLAGLTAGADAITEDGKVDIAGIAAITRYYGGGEEFGRFNQISQDVAALEQQMGLRPGAFAKMTYKERLALRERLADTAMSPAAATAAQAAWDRAESMLRQQGRLEEGALPGVLGAQNMFNRGIQTYGGDQVLAFISAVDSGLAQRIASTGGDPSKLDGHDNLAALRIMERGGLLNRSSTFFGRLGGFIGDNILKYTGYFDTAQGSSGGGGGGGAGPVRRMLDPAAVKEQVQQMWSQFFLADVGDEVVAAITKDLQHQLDNAPDGMSFDVNARITEFLRGRPAYGELYGKKPEGMSESDYQNQFMAGVQDMLGAEANVGAVRSGMRTGDYQTAVGRAAASEMAKDNSRMRGNWAQAKQVLDQFT